MTQVKSKFDFESQGPDELAFVTGEILTVLDTSVPGGWWKAQNSAGQQGFIPSDFVEALESEIESIPEPAFAPPPLPVEEHSAIPSSSWYPATDSYQTSHATVEPNDSWSAYPTPSTRQESNHTNVAPQTSGWDSDEFDEDDEVGESAPSSTSVARSISLVNTSGASAERRVVSPSTSTTSSSLADQPPSRPVPTKSAAPSGGSVFMKLSDYAKTGVGAFILGHMKTARPPSSDCAQIYVADGVARWRPRGTELGYDILPDHKVGGKLAGLKKFVEYSIAKRNSGLVVQRRYKQFDWLHEQLRNKFVVIAIPPLPHKQITGRYEEDFIELRKRGLQAWLSRVARHPVVSYSAVFQHFVSCTDLKANWKQGKRIAEKDEWQGGRWLLAIDAPPSAQLSGFNDREEVRRFEEYSESLSSAVRSMIDTQQLYSKKQACVYKRDYQKIGQSFGEFAAAFQKSSSQGLNSLSRSTQQTANVFDEISKLFGDQPDLDALPFIDALYEYKGILSDGLPEMLGLARSAAASVADAEKQAADGKMSQDDLEACRSRQRLLNLAILAEQSHLGQQEEADFEQMFCQFIRAQIMFYSNVTRKLEEALRLFPSSHH